jgi:hypothetical protein
LLEPFRKQPTDKEIRSCLFKLYHLEAEIQRDANRDEDIISDSELPRLWIITTSCSDELLNDQNNSKFKIQNSKFKIEEK